jgi:hypothetical protein
MENILTLKKAKKDRIQREMKKTDTQIQNPKEQT